MASEEGNAPPAAVTVEMNPGATEHTAKHKGPRFVILHYSPFKVVWDWITLLLVIYTAVFTPFAVAFLMNEDSRRNQLNVEPTSRLRNADYNQADPFVMIDLIVDIMFIIDIVINFRTTFLSNGDVITDPLKIAVNYVKGWFLIDAMAAVPLDLLLFGTGTSDTVTIMGVLKVARLLRLLRVLRRLDQYSQYGAAMLLIMMGVFTLVAHWLACGWYFIAHMEQARLDRPISWLDSLATAYQMPFYKNDSMSGPDIRSRYITALYFTLTTITSIGFGNVAAFTNGEKLFAIFAMMVGSLITAAIFGNVSSIMLRMYSGAEEYHEMQQSIKEFIKFHNIPKQLAKRLSDSYQQSWNVTNGIDMNSVLKGFPDCLQADICLHLNRNLLTNCPAFQGASPGCLRSLSLKFKTTLAPAYDTLIHPGDIIDCVYFIARGSIEIVKDDSVMAILGKNDIFGENITSQRLQQTCAEMQGIEFEKKVTKSNYYVRALTYCDMCKILTSDLDEVLDVYPEFANNFLSSFHVSFDLERGEYVTQEVNKKIDSETAKFIRQKRPRLQSRSSTHSGDLQHKPGRESNEDHTQMHADDDVFADYPRGVRTRYKLGDVVMSTHSSETLLPQPNVAKPVNQVTTKELEDRLATITRRIQTFESNLYTTVDAILDILGHKPHVTADKSPSAAD